MYTCMIQLIRACRVRVVAPLTGLNLLSGIDMGDDLKHTIHGDERKRGDSKSLGNPSRSNLSGKMWFVSRLLVRLKSQTNDKIVLISNFTQTLDVLERLCREFSLPCVRLDGSTSIKKRHSMVTDFNAPNSKSFAFLLSSKAGGCGINLIGANRLVLFDPDWNPANDKQALARVWRDGQKKTCYVYRLFSTGTIEEKIYQRQLSKDGLSAMIVGSDSGIKDTMSSDVIRDLFTLRLMTNSDTHDQLGCDRCPKKTTKTKTDENKMPSKNNSCREYVVEDSSDEDETSDDVPNQLASSDELPSIPQMEGDQFDEDNLLTWCHCHDPVKFHDDQIFVDSLQDCMTAVESFNPISFVMACRIQFLNDD
eukprot:GHVO01039448.1.p1 GENE.GHVO01039448.1~~GHVO01039448.1.p1  ORF type:complete len:365 (-),score=55.93 GHVO01039448.1:158-1252(-)